MFVGSKGVLSEFLFVAWSVFGAVCPHRQRFVLCSARDDRTFAYVLELAFCPATCVWSDSCMRMRASLSGSRGRAVCERLIIWFVRSFLPRTLDGDVCETGRKMVRSWLSALVSELGLPGLACVGQISCSHDCCDRE